MKTCAVPRLAESTLRSLQGRVQVPGYVRSAVKTGIVHFGPGAFHRGHQACYVDSLLANDPRWGICEAELRGAGLQGGLAPQDNLYVVAELDSETSFRVVGSIREYFSAEMNPNAIFARLADPAVSLVTMTVTEKGYCLDNKGDLDLNHTEIRHDLENADGPCTVVGWLTKALKARKDAALPPFVAMSCDNVSGNSSKLRRAVHQFSEALYGQELRDWIEQKVRFPSTMVDSITPATTDALKDRVQEAIGLRDEAPVNRESFRQWVIEDNLGSNAPDFAAAGATITNDIEAYEQAKLRLLNAAHSTLAYAGSLRGYDSVDAAMRDTALASFVERMLRERVAPTLRPADGLDFDSYITAILKRFKNPALTHKLLQIAADGSQKLPIRILVTITDFQNAGRPIGELAMPVAAWMHFVVKESKEGRTLSDPLAAALAIVGKSCTGEAHHDVTGFLSLTEVFPKELSGDPYFVAAVSRVYKSLASGEILT